MSKPVQRRTFTKEFKRESVEFALSSEKTVAEVSRDLGIKENNLRRWINEYQEDPDHAFPGPGNLKGPDVELHQLRKQVADLRMERDILKKALAIFSKTSP